MTDPRAPEPAAPTQHPDPDTTPISHDPLDTDTGTDTDGVGPFDREPADTGGAGAAHRRQQLTSALSATVLEAAARRLADAVADYDAALDRHAFMPELRRLDQEVARAERDHAAAAAAVPEHTDPTVSTDHAGLTVSTEIGHRAP